MSLSVGSLNGTNGFRIEANLLNGFLGASVSFAGDVNGDGFDDVIIGSPGGALGKGMSYVLYGHSGGFGDVLDVAGIGLPEGPGGFRIEGVSAAGPASFVSGLGDVNGDGIDDLLIGAPLTDFGFLFDAGAAYVLFGRAEGFGEVVSLADLDGLNGFMIEGANFNDQLGRTAAGVGDVNGDGVDDFIVGAQNAAGAAGASYLIYGKSAAESFAATLAAGSLAPGDGVLISAAEGISTGLSGAGVAGIGDLNGDGIDDFIIGAPGETGDTLFSGASYVVFGKAGGFAEGIDLTALDGLNGFKLSGASLGDQFGKAVSGAGDVNGDGIEDLLVGAPGASAAYVLFGKTGAFDPEVSAAGLTGANGFRIDGAPASLFGSDIAGVGDVNGDGLGDLLIGGPTNPGSVIFGRADGFAPIVAVNALTEQTGFTIGGALNERGFGQGASPAGDLNGDGVDDLIVGDPYAGPLSGGAAYVIYGMRNSSEGDDRLVGSDLSEVLDGLGGDDLISGAGGDDTLRGGEGDDTLIGGGGNDVLSGGEGNDQALFSGLREAYEITEAGADLLVENLATGDVNRLTADIEALVFDDGSFSFQSFVASAPIEIGDGELGDGLPDEGEAGDSPLIEDDLTDGGLIDDGLIDSDETGGLLPVIDDIELPDVEIPDQDLTGPLEPVSRGLVVKLTNQADEVEGTEFADEISGLRGRDLLTGLGGDDRLFGGGGKDTLDGGAGADLLEGGGGRDSLSGGLGRDTLDGGKGKDVLDGGAGRDMLFGGGANDRLIGGRGNDVLTGGNGKDRFVFDLKNGRDKITDFQQGKDKIEFTAGSEAFADLEIRQKGDNVLIVHAGGKIIIEDDAVSNFAANDFIFA